MCFPVKVLLLNVLCYIQNFKNYQEEEHLGEDHDRELRSKKDNVLKSPFTLSFKDSFTVKNGKL